MLGLIDRGLQQIPKPFLAASLVADRPIPLTQIERKAVPILLKIDHLERDAVTETPRRGTGVFARSFEARTLMARSEVTLWPIASVRCGAEKLPELREKRTRCAHREFFRCVDDNHLR
jgi:hypothetical protein